MQFNLLDAAGTTIDTSTETVQMIIPGAQAIVAPLQIGFQKGEPATMTAAVVKIDGFVDGTALKDCKGFTIYKGIPVEVVAPTIVRDGSYSDIKGQLKNSGTELVERVSIDCVLRAAGVIVGGELTASMDPIPPGQTVAFSASSYVVQNADTVDCQATA